MSNHLRLAFASCQRWEHGHYAAWRHLCADAPDLVLFLGDYIYEYASPCDTTGLARVHSLRHATTLADFRDRHALHKSDPHLQAAHAHCPWAVTWDDHEVQNDYAGSAGKGDPAAFLPCALRPGRPLRAHAAACIQPGGARFCAAPAAGLGRLAHIHLLDTRQYRNLQACRSPRSSGAGATRPDDCPALQDPVRSMLGPVQEQVAGPGTGAGCPSPGALERAGAKPPSSRRATTPRACTRRTPGTATRRAPAPLHAIARHAPRNTVLLGGDIHQNYVPRAAHPDRPDGPALASEFCGTSISSRSGTTQDKVDAVARRNPMSCWRAATSAAMAWPT